MGDTSGCTCQLKLSDASSTRDGSSQASDIILSASASDAEYATTAQRIEQSKSHWSMLAEQSGHGKRETQLRPPRKWKKLIFCCSNKKDEEVAEESDVKVFEEVAEESNVKVFEDLQSHPTRGSFFLKQDKFAEFEVGKKFAEGGQAELYHVQVMWSDPRWNEYDQERGIEYVLKVFKKGTFLRDLQFQVPHGYLDFRAEVEKWAPDVRVPRFHCEVYRGVLLKDGRFAFLMEREHFDLRYVIDCNMKSRNCGGKGPFSKEEAECIMYQVAVGVDFLHRHNIIHRDLKASNVLVMEHESGYPKFVCHVADFESFAGVLGTGFFRAPEILEACKDGKLRERPNVFSAAADIYSYGMVCYEVLTGKLPFEGHLSYDYNFVLNGQCLVIPDYVESWTCELLKKCWQLNPISRPRIGEILDLFLVHSIEARKFEEVKNRWGQNYRDWSST